MNKFFSLLGRLCICSIFIFSSIQDFLQWGGQEDYVLNVLTQYMNSFTDIGYVHQVYQFLMANITLFLTLGILLKFLGGLFLLFGWQVKLGSCLLLLFLIPVTLIFHDFWNQTGQSKIMQTVMFWKNIGLAGGLFLLLSQNEGSKQKNAKADKKQAE